VLCKVIKARCTKSIVMKEVHIIHKEMPAVFDVFGLTISFLTLQEHDSIYCIMHGTIPPRLALPLHSHPDDESFYILSGVAEVLTQHEDSLRWTEVTTGSLTHIPPEAKHAWRNQTSGTVDLLITTTPRLGKFFREIGRPIIPGKKLSRPTPEELEQFVLIAKKYNHWLGSHEENAAYGIHVFG
jgi:quercetin dioxygenase-like cupin family protein